MKKRNLVIALLVTLMVALSGATFAYWASSVSGNNDSATGTITIGEGGAATTSVTVADETDGGLLVPSGNEDDVTTFDNVDLTFSVNWDAVDAEASGAASTLSVSVDSVVISGGASDGQDILVGSVTGWELITVSVTSGEGAITEGIPVDVVVNVEFTNEPLNQAQYDAIANLAIVVTLTFTVA
eukprot:Anaeramoba_ignava/c8415_g1_i1.p5 GENE.c8415_g1_i1~~c8415_g1_i1.p5  ORF type:complete len:184 (-),score=18.00 c8415_g1_i1:2084-2635(-)